MNLIYCSKCVYSKYKKRNDNLTHVQQDYRIFAIFQSICELVLIAEYQNISYLVIAAFSRESVPL